MEAIPHDPHHNHRDSPVINAELASAVSVGSKTLSAFRPGDLGVREKLRLASTCTAKYEEDIAYSLFGIFASDGEGKDALGHLLEEIVHHSGDVYNGTRLDREFIRVEQLSPC